jgi:thiol-disulfide isomerase/thioredoxin
VVFRAILVLLGAGLLWGGEALKPAPELKVALAEGGDFLMSKQRGKVVALAMVYTTCAHCQRTSQVLDKLYREYGGRGFQPVAVACNDGAELLAGAFARELQLGFPVGIGYPGLMFEYLGIAPRPIRLPVLVVIDRKGMIRWTFTGESPLFTNTETNLRKMLGPLLAEPKPGGKSR